MAESLIDFLERPSVPLKIKSLDTFSDIKVLRHRPGSDPEPLVVEGLYPFMTLMDVKLAIYNAMKKSPDAHPDCLYVSAEDSFEPIDYTWVLGRREEVFKVTDPFATATGPIDERFVDSNGARRILKFVARDRVIIEEMYPEMPVFHVFMFKDVASMIPGPKPPSERDWNGRLFPLFPYLETGSAGPSQERIDRTEHLLNVFLTRSEFSDKIERLLFTPTRTPTVEPLKLTGIRNMRLIWQKTEHIQGIENVFYEVSVNDRRPYMRFIPTSGSPISKIHLVDGKPDLTDPKVLIQWSQDRSPMPNHDIMIAKILIRKGYTNVSPIYGTLRVLDDGTADYTLVPPHGVRKLDPLDDLRGTWTILQEGIRGMPFLKEPTLDRGLFIFSLKSRKDTVQTASLLRDKLPVFSGFLQEIEPIPGDSAMITLRYKCVSNFATEDRVFSYITQKINRGVVSGEGINSQLVTDVATEFQISEEEAMKRVADKMQNKDNIVIVKPETGEFTAQYNPGIDISVFGQHPFYSFHIHRIDSFRTMERITTLLSLLISGTEEELRVSLKRVVKLGNAERAVNADSDEFEEVEEVEEPPKSAVPLRVPDTMIPAEEAEYDDMFLNNFAEEFGDSDADDAAIPIAEPATIPVQPPTVVEPVQAVQAVATTGDVSIANFFINKLKDADKRLFDYTRTHPSLKKYVQQCQPTDGRQPAVISKEKYDEMLKEYKKDKNVVFVLYPLLEGTPDERPTHDPSGNNIEYYTVLRYGTSGDRQNYYLCCQYFCTRDELLVREKDLLGTGVRRKIQRADGSTVTEKRPGQCPFCLGTVIENKKNPRPTDTIIERGVKAQSDNKRHLYIRFLKKTPHPEGFYLPCCFLDDTPVNSMDPSFAKYGELGIPKRPDVDRPPAPVQDTQQQETGVPQVDYHTVIYTLGKRGKYILGAEKFPLEIGLITASGRGEPQVGLLPPVLDTYFNQNPNDFVTRSFTQQTIKDGGVGFLRLGVENRIRYKSDSFLAAIAPYFKGMNSAKDIKNRILALIHPREYLALNYGNLVLEFYNHIPNLKIERPGEEPIDLSTRPDDKKLIAWIKANNLEGDLYTQNKEAYHRLYNSWYNFESWLQDPRSTPKEYRHFALLLSQPGLFEVEGGRRGTTFIVLDVLQSGKMEVRCPPYGYNDDLMGRNNIAFLYHHWSGVWEPIFYADNRPHHERKTDAGIMKFDGAYKGFSEHWPAVVKQRASEFVTQCNFSGRSIYTSQANINANSMIPLSLFYRTMRREKNKGIEFRGVVRDSYNHVGALLYSIKGKSGGCISVPVADDGDLGPLILGQSYLDWDDPDFKKATILESFEFYKEVIDTDFSLYPGYTMQFLVVKKKGASDSFVPRPIQAEDVPHIVGIKLRNGLYVPTATPSGQEATDLTKSRAFVIEIEREEWQINNELAYDRDVANEIDRARVKYDELDEIYEHLRLTFSNYLSSSHGTGMRSAIQKISTDRTRPLSEKRKDLEILIGPIIMNKMLIDDDIVRERVEPSLLRTDCTLKGDAQQCLAATRCGWQEESGRCMLHVNKRTDLGNGRQISVKMLMLRRLNDELLRFSERRRQIFDKKVSRIAAFDTAITIDDQMIVREKSLAWSELLRLEWTRKVLYIEEMGREAPAPIAVKAGHDIPADVVERLGGDAAGLKMVKLSWKALLTAIGLSPSRYDVTSALKAIQLQEIVRETGKPAIQINMASDEPVEAYKPPYMNYSTAIIIVVTEGSPGLIVTNPEEPTSILVSSLPAALSEKIKKARIVLKPATAGKI